MSVTETIGAIGSFSIALSKDTPQNIVDQLKDRPAVPAYFGHLVVHSGRLTAVDLGDSLLKSSRYTGVYRSFAQGADDTITLGGAGMSVWLGDEDQKGAVIESLTNITAQTFPNSIRALLPPAVHEGTLHPGPAGTFTTQFQFIDPKSAIDYVCTTMGGEYRVNGDATIDAGLVSDLYRTIPDCALVANDAGVDMSMRALPGEFETQEDVDDFTTRVVLLAQGEGAAIATGTANIAPASNPYKDLWGNTLKMTRMVSESTTDTGNADVRAQLSLSQYESTRDALTLDTGQYDIKGDLVVGDNIFVYDPKQGLYDNSKEITFRGERINPIVLRVTESTWPVSAGMSVAFRTPVGVWIDLTQWIQWETGTSTVVVGGYNRSLTNTGEPIGSRPVADSSVPGVPTWNTPFIQGVYQSSINGQTRAQTQLSWTQPLNTDGSAIIDGDHYEIWYRQSTTPIFPSTWEQLEGMTWAALETATWGQPLEYPQGPWQTTIVGFDNLTFMLEELVPSHPYEVQIRAVDGANPPNFGSFSAITTFQTSDDTIAPETPAPPIVDSSLVAVQITHTLGVAAGGTFNLDADLHHLEIHGQYEPTFTPDDTTLIGKLVANNGMISGEIPAVGTFTVTAVVPTYFKVVAVDTAGNKSLPSDAVVATPDLIDDAHISDLTATKITAGTITSDILLAGSIKTANTGARTEIDINGIRSFNNSGVETFDQDNTDGSITVTGTIQTAQAGQRIVINPDPGGDGLARIDIYDNDTTTHTTQVAFGSNFLMQRESNGTRTNNGGFMQWAATEAFFGMRATSLDVWMFFDVNGHLKFKGSFASGDPQGGEVATWVQAAGITISTGNGSIGFGWGATMIGFMTPFTSVQNTDGTLFAAPFNVNTTGLTISWQHNGGTSSGSGTGTVNCWAVRRT